MSWWPRFGQAWEALGRKNALGAILTCDNRLAEWDLADFLATGQAEAERFLSELPGFVPSAARRRALDFGCGVGRVTRQLAGHFNEVVGVDVAASMIARARAINADRPNCAFVLNRAPHLRRFPDGAFDVVYSRLVLQHIRPSIARRYIAELVRVLAPGGALIFQLPEDSRKAARELYEQAVVHGSPLKRSLPRWLVVFWRRIKYWSLVTRPGAAQIEMFGMPRDTVVDLVHRAGGRVVQMRADRSHGLDVPGFEYWVTRSVRM